MADDSQIPLASMLPQPQQAPPGTLGRMLTLQDYANAQPSYDQGQTTDAQLISNHLNDYLTRLSTQYAQDPAGPLVADYMARFQGQPGTLTDEQRRAALGNLATAAGSLVGSVGPIRAFHGSPHDFDAFDLSKIGTGEGAQAYGHGLYFAEHEPVAQQYRDQLQWKGANFDDPQVIAQNAIDRNGGREAAANSLESALNSTKAFYRGNVPAPQAAANAASERAIALLRSDEPITGKPQTPGKMYEVNLHADPASLLDWDKPLSEQPQVAAKLPSVNQNDPVGAVLKRAYSNPMYGGDLIGADRATPNEVTAALAQRGIPGIQYLDAGSRGAGAGTRNYVMFDPKLIEILRKYGVIPPLATMTALSGGGQQQQ